MPIRSPAHAALGKAIRKTRLERGLTQETLADQCELDRTYISGIERGERNPSLTNILKVAAALDVRQSSLLALAEDLGCPEGQPRDAGVSDADGDASEGVPEIVEAQRA
jgi:transcriptional regulator with XRE-family HTH domain